jgi:hypothetical protein
MAKAYKHPISGFVYSVNGVWSEGEIVDVDLQAAGWVGRTPEARALREANS